MFEKFQWIQNRFEELSVAIGQPEIIADQAKYQQLLKERSALEPSVAAWDAYQACLHQLDEAREMLSDPDLCDVAQAEVEELTARKTAMEQELRILLLPRDPDDDKNVVVEIRSGTGGDEACLFAADMMRMYTRYAERHGFRVEPLSASTTELGGIKEAVFSLTGQGAFAHMKYESGVHQVKRIPVTESNGRIQTSTCTVAVLPEAEEVELTLLPKDLRIDVYRASGHGGQCVNTTDSAVRITHLPTGIVATCQDEKSQIKNRDKAMKVLRSRVLEKLRTEQDEAYAANRRSQVGTGERAEKIRTYHFLQGRVTDHRLGLTLYRTAEIMDGDLDEFIEALRMEEQAQKLQALS
ncbi:MAG: peptide chain release factor 1 [Clostridia bacterium]|nr:peptide chain release factor 1 [Clostridia bacterium]